MVKGIYILLIEVAENRRIRIGRLGVLEFPRGLYAYVGSAQNGLEKRIGRHLRKGKGKFWHIDYLLERGRVLDVYTKGSGKDWECRTAGSLAKRFKPIAGFGCSDCRCRSHLFFLG